MNRLPLALLITSALLALPAWALDPQAVDIQGLKFYPSLAVGERYDDNYRELPDDAPTSRITTVEPRLRLVAEDRNSAYRLSYSGSQKTYHDDDDASHLDHRLRLESILEFTARHRLNLEAAYNRLEQTASTAVPGENDEYSLRTFGSTYRFGAETARNNLELAARHERLRFHDDSLANASEERDANRVGLTWFHRIGGTRALLETRYEEFDYVRPDSPLNSHNLALLTGAVWEASARTSGRIRAGYQRKEYDDDSRDGLESPMWEVGLDWKPRTYSTFSLTTRQAYDEGDDGADAIKHTRSRLDWRHEWSSRISSTVTLGAARLRYQGLEREDDLSSAGLTLTYQPRRWLELALGYSHWDNDSTEDRERFKRNLYSLTATGSL
ncbi:MAG TPA: outer membrane beta-barrel protein [Pseudomonas sp.]|jgi:hypothetical protein|nr:outer membrane beta-barrel protein [Pseudomonas sp.]